MGHEGTIGCMIILTSHFKTAFACEDKATVLKDPSGRWISWKGKTVVGDMAISCVHAKSGTGGQKWWTTFMQTEGWLMEGDVTVVGGDFNMAREEAELSMMSEKLGVSVTSEIYPECSHATRVEVREGKTAHRVDDILVAMKASKARVLTSTATPGPADHHAIWGVLELTPAQETQRKAKGPTVPNKFRNLPEPRGTLERGVIMAEVKEALEVLESDGNKQWTACKRLDMVKKLLVTGMANWEGVSESEWVLMEEEYINQLQKGTVNIKDAMESWKTNINTHAKQAQENFKDLMKENWNQPTPMMWQWVKPEVQVNNLQKVTTTIQGEKIEAIGEKQIGRLATQHMQQVFEKQPWKRKKWKGWLKKLQGKGKWPTIPTAVQIEMMKPLTVQEVRKTFAKGRMSTAPGPRNFPGDMWSKMIHESQWLAVIVTEAWTEIIQSQGAWPRTFEDSITKMIWKQKGLPEDLSNWRPISVMDWDYRAFQRLVSTRCMLALPILVDETQKGFMPGRRIQENLWLLRAAMSQATNNMCAVFLDFKGAYDTVPPQLLVDIMVASHFPKPIVEIVKKATIGLGGRIPYTHIQMNGATCPEKVYLHRGVRQGDPSSTWQYDLVSLLLTRMIAHKLKAVKVGGTRTHSREFADDIAVYTKFAQLSKLSKVLIEWEKMTTMRLGSSKCAILPLGKVEAEPIPTLQTREGTVKLMGPGDTYSYAGVEVGMDEKVMAEQTWGKVVTKIHTRLLAYKLSGTSEQFRQQVVVAVANGAVNYYATVLPVIEKYLANINTTLMRLILKTNSPAIKAHDYLHLKELWGGNKVHTPLQTALVRQGQLAIGAFQGEQRLKDLKLLITKDIQLMQFGKTSSPHWFWCKESYKLGASMLRSANMVAPQTTHYITAQTPLWASRATQGNTAPTPRGEVMTRTQEQVLGFKTDATLWGNPKTREVAVQANLITHMTPLELYQWGCNFKVQQQTDHLWQEEESLEVLPLTSQPTRYRFFIMSFITFFHHFIISFSIISSCISSFSSLISFVPKTSFSSFHHFCRIFIIFGKCRKHHFHHFHPFSSFYMHCVLLLCLFVTKTLL